MTAEKKLYAQFVWEDVELNKTVRTIEAPNPQSALAYGVRNHALYFTMYKAEAPDDKLAAAGRRLYTATMESKLQNTADIVAYLEQNKSVPHLAEYTGEVLPRMFGRVTRDAELQEKFNTASRKPDIQERFAAVIDLLKKELPGEVFLTPGHGGFIRMEQGDTSYDSEFRQRYPNAPKR